jgi:pyruvate dehydrogenase E2 component (dihydrolipoamide acetyltransferase)
MPDFKLPDLGEGVTEAEIDRWLVKEGDTIEEDTPIVEVITDKATAEIPSPYEGVVTKIHVGEGDTVPVGTVLITIGEGAPSAPAVVMADEAPAAATVGAVPASPGVAAPAGASGNGSGTIKAMPPVRKLARELGVDLSAVEGSGPGGRIMRADVEAASGKPTIGVATPLQQSPPTHIPVGAGERREPYRGIRKRIGENMQHAHVVVPPVTHVEECDVTQLDATRRIANQRAEAKTKLTYLPFIVKAVVSALKQYPALNASLDESSNEIVIHGNYNIGVAVDTPNGLVVPVIHDADKRTLREVATEIERLAAAARDGKLTNVELKGGTFTVTSPGPFGGLMATPIVFHPQSGILGVHRAVDRAVVRDGQIVIRKMMNLSITFDHRILDGVTAAKFCLQVVESLEHPAVLALES